MENESKYTGKTYRSKQKITFVDFARQVNLQEAWANKIKCTVGAMKKQILDRMKAMGKEALSLRTCKEGRHGLRQ